MRFVFVVFVRGCACVCLRVFVCVQRGEFMCVYTTMYMCHKTKRRHSNLWPCDHFFSFVYIDRVCVILFIVVAVADIWAESKTIYMYMYGHINELIPPPPSSPSNPISSQSDVLISILLYAVQSSNIHWENQALSLNGMPNCI